MELHAYTKTISDLFSVKKKYIVPRFQREYSWTKEQVFELWNDIVANISIEDENLVHTEYFIGSLVLVGDDKSISLQIVDGQQRLTTITILLSALCQRFLELNKKNIAESIYENYIAGKDDEGEYYFKLENETPKPFFQTRIQHIEKEEKSPSSEEEKSLLNSYNELYSFTSIKNLKEKFDSLDLDNEAEYTKLLKAIRDQVVKYLKVIFITVNDEDEAYTIFETLNARGMNLSFVDLIKNKVFKNLNQKHPDDSAKTKWKNLRKIIVSREGTGNLEVFVRHWWISRYAYVSAANVYKSFKNKWNSGEIKASTFLDEIISDAELYIKIISPVIEDFKQQEEKDLYRSLSALRIFNVSQQRPFILSLFKAKERGLIKLSELKEILSFIEKFHFFFNAVCSMRPSGIEGSYSKAARQIFEAQDKHTVKNVIGELKKQLTSRLPDKDTFKDKFSKLKFIRGYTKHKKLIQYIFSYIESSKQTTSEFKPDSITLEHILSQSEGDKDYIGSIGNLLPLGSELNEKAGNKKILDKLEIYKQSQFDMTREFAIQGIKNWDEKEIQSRTFKLAEYCYDRAWKIG